jgi:hypothetical protein
MKNIKHHDTKVILGITKIIKITNSYKQIKVVIDQTMTRYKDMTMISEVVILQTKSKSYLY